MYSARECMVGAQHDNKAVSKLHMQKYACQCITNNCAYVNCTWLCTEVQPVRLTAHQCAFQETPKAAWKSVSLSILKEWLARRSGEGTCVHVPFCFVLLGGADCIRPYVEILNIVNNKQYASIWMHEFGFKWHADDDAMYYVVSINCAHHHVHIQIFMCFWGHRC